MAAVQDRRIIGCVDKIIHEAIERGIERFSCNGCCEDDWDQVKQLSSKYAYITPNFGLHPWWVAGRSEGWLDRLRQALLHVPVAGLGECGLDHARQGIAERPVQEQAFQQQLQLSKELQRPISVHCVKAFGALQDILEKEGPFPAGLVLHSWAGSDQATRRLARMQGVHFSLSGHTLGLSDRKLVPMLREVPLDRLLLETDSPDGLQPLQRRNAAGLVPIPPCSEDSDGQDSRLWNHPANIRQVSRAVLEIVAECRRQPQQDIAEAAYNNACRLYHA